MSTSSRNRPLFWVQPRVAISSLGRTSSDTAILSEYCRQRSQTISWFSMAAVPITIRHAPALISRSASPSERMPPATWTGILSSSMSSAIRSRLR